MGRTETILLTATGALVLYVGVQVARVPKPPAAPPISAADTAPMAAAPQATRSNAPAAPVAPAAAPRPQDLSIDIRRSSEPPPVRDLADIRRQLSGATDTYASDMLATQDSILVRWPDRRADGLRIWVQSGDTIPAWNPEYQHVARDIFDEWVSAGVPLRPVFVLDSAGADIQIQWIPRFAPSYGRAIGLTRRTSDQNGWISKAVITVALHDSAGHQFTAPELAGIIRHEVGHALGLGHSKDRATMMYPEETVHDIAPLDRATLRLVYALPPGTLK